MKIRLVYFLFAIFISYLFIEEIRKKLKAAIATEFVLVGVNDFEFVRVKQSTISVPDHAPGLSFSYQVIKALVGQG